MEKDKVNDEVVSFCYDDESLQVIDVKGLSFATCPLRLIDYTFIKTDVWRFSHIQQTQKDKSGINYPFY